MEIQQLSEDAPPVESISLDIYGYRVVIRCSVDSVLFGLADDFAFFRRESVLDAHCFELFETDPPYGDMPNGPATVYTPRNVSYRHGGLTIVDYSGRALGIHNRETGNFRLFSRHTDLLYEACYLFLLSQCGETFDARGLHRVHALGIAVDGLAALVLLPMGGGKSTLGSHLLAFPEVQLLSDDSPLIDHLGGVHAFPLRLGLLPGSEGSIPKEHLRMIQRMEFGPKFVLNHSYFADRICAYARTCLIFLGQRSLGTSCEIVRAGKVAALRAMLANCVVGIGLFQGMEFVLHGGVSEILTKARAGTSRLTASARLVAKSNTYRMILGRDSEKNARTLFEFVKAQAARK